MADLLVAFSFLKIRPGRRAGVLGGGGGRTVQSADLCQEAGFTLVPLPSEMRSQLQERAPQVWDWVSNPVDRSILGGCPISGEEMLEIMSLSPEFDVLLANMGEDGILGNPSGTKELHARSDRLVEIGRKIDKPLAVVLAPPDSPEEWHWRAVIGAQQRFVEGGLAFFPSISRAARAVSAFVRYWEERARAEVSE
jgi:acyl-CoA synthetase (NDP forming)